MYIISQCDAFKKLITRPKSTGHNDEGAGGHHHPELTGEEVVEHEGQLLRHVRVAQAGKRLGPRALPGSLNDESSRF